MKVTHLFTYAAAVTQTIFAASIPDAHKAPAILGERDGIASRAPDILSPDHTLERRKGGGGRGGGGSSSGGSRSSGSSTGGGATRGGSGPSRSYGGGGYYGGGAAVPYSAGSRTPKGLLAGALLAPVVLLAIMPGLWLYNAYPYYYSNPYRFVNETLRNETNPNGINATLPVMCLCQEFSVCGCDENDNSQYLKDLIGNGSYAALNKSLITVAAVNGTQTLVLNGTLPDGTTAPGGTDGAGVSLKVSKYAAYWMMGLVVLYGVML